MNRPFATLFAGVVLLPLGIANTASAWHSQGHELASKLAVAALSDDVPAFFRDAANTIARDSIDPDLFRDPLALELTIGEAPEHFFDMELLRGTPVPPNRYAFIALCADLKISPKMVGTLPYAVTEWTQKLMIAFAEHRRSPADRDVHAKCLVYAGILSHYAADLCQPLHVTVDFDGRASVGGRSPHSGIHNKVDALPSRLSVADVRVEKSSVHAFEKILPAVVEELGRSHALVDRVYELEPRLPPANGEGKSDPAVMDFTRERMRASGTFAASLFLTAWQQSAYVQLPEWSESGKSR